MGLNGICLNNCLLNEDLYYYLLARSPNSCGPGWPLSPWGPPLRRQAPGSYGRGVDYANGAGEVARVNSTHATSHNTDGHLPLCSRFGQRSGPAVSCDPRPSGAGHTRGLRLVSSREKLSKNQYTNDQFKMVIGQYSYLHCTCPPMTCA